MLEAIDLSAGFGTPLFQGVSMRLPAGEILGLHGTSGVGKTTLGRVLAGLHTPMAGTVRIGGVAQPRRGIQPVQYLHQSPLQAMNPRWRVGRILSEAAPPDPARSAALGLDHDWLARFPHELSGGQLQRVSILRALSVSPAYLVADEITASLDPVSQARTWGVLKSLAHQQRIGILAISHDLGLLQRICTCGLMKL